MTKRLFTLLILALTVMLSAKAQTSADTLRHQVLLQTTKGDIVIELYNETPLHRDNFLKLVKKGYYDGNLFHRVIADFMIQTGDSTSRHSKPDVVYGEYSVNYEIPAEIHYPQLFHERGAVAAARQPDEVNPEHKSSGSQFYIVYGNTCSDLTLDRYQEKLDEKTDGKIQMTKDIRRVYKTVGGTPFLDGMYTVFGHVVKGLNVVRDIDYVQTDENDRPVEDVRIIKASVIK